MNAYIFPGQGTQFSGMGLDLYENSPLAQELFEQANDILGFNITDTMFEGSAEDLKETKVTQPAKIYCGNMGVVINSSNPVSTLNKKTIALAYHFTREHIANNVVKIRKVDTEDNYADPLTKALNSVKFNGFFYKYLRN